MSTHLRVATLFGGGEGVGVGARSVGVEHAWGVEYDADIAAVAERNGFRTIVADVRDVSFPSLPRPDILHASPPCISFSKTNRRGGETDLDRALAAAVVRAVRDIKPRIFTLENVPQYCGSDGLRTILHTLDALDYHIERHVLDAADFGVPQHRVRLFVVARRGSPILPPLALQRERHRSWHSAVADLVSSFDEWALSARLSHRLRTEYRLTFPMQVGRRIRPTVVAAHRPSQTVAARPDLTLLLDSSTSLRFTARAGARLQSFPDDYWLPDRATLAWRVIGNAVPPRLYAAILDAALATM